MGADDPAGSERRLREAFARGELLDLRSGPEDGIEQAETWPADRWVRADLLAGLLVGPDPSEAGAVARLRLAGVRVTGELDLSHAQIEYPIEFEDCAFDSGIRLHEAQTRSIRFTRCRFPNLDANRFELRGELQAQGSTFESMSLYSSRVDEIEISGSRISSPGKVALNWDLLTVRSAVYCQDVQIEGTVRLPGARIEGQLQLSGTRIVNESGPALHAWGLVVGNGVFCHTGFTDERNPFAATGEVDLSNAQIRGPLVLDGALLSNPDGTTLGADQIAVEGSVFLRGLTSYGEIRLRSATVSGPLSLAGSQLANRDGIAFHADRVVADGGVFLHAGFASDGQIRLVGAEIHGNLDLDLTTVAGLIDLHNAQVRTLRSFTQPAAVRLSGLQYEGLEPNLPAGVRLMWLAKDRDGYQPQPYEQLAAHYRRIGQDEDARRVLLTKQRRRRGRLTRPGKAWGFAQDWLVGYGYRPWLAAGWLVGLLAAGTSYFAANRPPALEPGSRTEFDGFAYTLDLLLPVINLGQESAWSPHGLDRVVAYALIVAGWVLATAVVAGVTRVLSRG
jgi:hypothetical protein